MFEILFYTVLVLGIITLLATFFLIPLDNNNQPEFTYDNNGNVIDNFTSDEDNEPVRNDSGEIIKDYFEPIVNDEPARIVAHAIDNKKTPSDKNEV